MKVNSIYNLMGTILIIVFFSSCLVNKIKTNDQIMQNYINKMVNIEGLSYNMEYKFKGLFDKDTSIKYIDVKFVKSDSQIYFLEINVKDYPFGLVLLNDSIFIVDHNNKLISYQGNHENLNKMDLLSYFPEVGLFYSKMYYKKIAPFWSFISNEGSTYKFRLNVTKNQPEIELNSELTIDKNKLLLNSIYYNANFANIGNQIQVYKFDNFKTITKNSIKKPEYFKNYKVEPTENIKDEKDTMKISKSEYEVKIYVDSFMLYNLDGNAFILPQDGYIFIDLWYVGCYPCLKAAPEVEKVFHKYKDKVHFFSINDIDNDIEKINRFKEKMNLTIPVLKSKDNKPIRRPIESNAYPYFILFKAETGKLIWHQEGFPPDLENRISEAIESVLVK